VKEARQSLLNPLEARPPLDESSGYIQRPHLRAIHFKPARAPITAG